MKVLLFIACCGFSIINWAQDLTVPDEILENLETVVITTKADTFTFRVDYPDGYNKDKEYPVFLGLSGGDQSMEIVNYCYAAWFQSGYFKDYFTILPVNTSQVNILNYKPEDIAAMYDAIMNYFNVSDQWMIAGTSNGGVAAFNFLAVNPKLFEGIIVAPGMISDDIVPDETWSHLSVILAYGDKDASSWIKHSKVSAKKLKKVVKSVQLVPLKNQGHILPISFNVDKMYDPYFLGDN